MTSPCYLAKSIGQTGRYFTHFLPSFTGACPTVGSPKRESTVLIHKNILTAFGFVTTEPTFEHFEQCSKEMGRSPMYKSEFYDVLIIFHC